VWSGDLSGCFSLAFLGKWEWDCRWTFQLKLKRHFSMNDCRLNSSKTSRPESFFRGNIPRSDLSNDSEVVGLAK
jgi:hypothetical protein